MIKNILCKKNGGIMDFREINTFIHVANQESFSKAADVLGYTQAAVSIQIKQLESELGTRLFDRIGKHISLTHQGKAFYQYALRITSEIEEAKDVLSGSQDLNGTLRIGTIESICSSILPDILSRYHALHPAVEISIITDSPEALLDMMNKSCVDLVYFMDKRMYDPKWVKILEEPENIIRVLDEFFAANGELKGKKVMITAGPTYEKIDPVRFIGNYSSGKMGFALAEECARRGAEVTLIAGPVQLETRHSRIRRIDVESAEEMYAASQACFFDSDAAILCAAVADFRPEMVADKKIKREKEEELTLHLRATKDIAASLGAVKRKDQLLVRFALETNNEQQNAEGKLERKNFDFIVLNSLNDAGAGFRHDTNKISIIDRKGRTDYPLKSKTEVARDIIDRLSDELIHLTLNS